ncbi:MAG: hypothetical protein AAGE01_21155 [Pseudomonadota bacterium]
MTRALALLALVALTSTALAQPIAISDGETLTFDIPSGANRASNIFFDVPADVRNVLVELDGSLDSRDIDLFLKADTPFSEPLTAIEDEADFRSVSAFDFEYVNLQDFAVPPVQGRRWYVGIIAFDGLPTEGSLTVRFDRDAPPRTQFIVDFDNVTGIDNCDTAPWNDGGAHTPIGGNNAATLGQARREAMLRAAATLSSELTSRVPIRITACWRAVEGTPQEGAVAFAGTNFVFTNFPGMPPDTAYSQAPALRLAGTEYCRLVGGDQCDETAIVMTFVTELAPRFYYGFQPRTDSEPGIDFITTAMHEIGHGLGFQAFVRQDGSLFESPSLGQTHSAYSRRLAFLDDDQNLVRFDAPGVTNEDRAAAIVSFTDLLWIDDQASIQDLNTLITFESGAIRMEAPPDFSGGSSVSHVSGAYCDLMRPAVGLCRLEANRTLGLSRQILHGVGWVEAPTAELDTGLFLDRSRPGHGYDLRFAGTDASGQGIYVLTFYSYKTLGATPEWFQAIGTVQDGAFTGLRNTDGNGMPRYLYDAASEPPQSADPGTFAQVALSLNDVGISTACTDDVDRAGVESRGSFQWAITNQVGEWCAEPLVGSAAVPDPELDFGGLWWVGPEDNGWGFTIETIAQADGSLSVFVLAYVYDAAGEPIWFFAVGDGVQPGTPITMPMFQRNGYSRTRTNGNLTDTEAGELTLTLTAPSQDPAAGNRADINVNFGGRNGGSWVRDVPIRLLTLPRSALN